jgi:16S rRNA processing protein RimM
VTSRRVCVGAFAGAHGVRGAVRLKSFTTIPEDIASYGTLEDEAGSRTFRVRVTGEAKGMLIANVDGTRDRDAAQALKGIRLYVDRDSLPEPEEDEFYHADLVGLVVELPDGTPFGRIRGVADHGAGDVIEITRDGAPAVLTPFTKAAVPVVDIKGGRVVFDPPEEVIGEETRRVEAGSKDEDEPAG